MAQLSEALETRIALMRAGIADVAPPGHPPPRRMSEGSDQHKRLFQEYLPALQRSRQKAEDRWNGLVRGLIERTGKTRERAIRDVQASKPAARAAHAELIATVRRYWLACAQLNDVVPEQRRVAPEDFILTWLAEVPAVECIETLTEFTYFPVGLTKEGRWI
jgi:hypothetical protein